MTPSSPITIESIMQILDSVSKKQKETTLALDTVSKQLGGISHNLGAQAEEFFYRGLKKRLQNIAGIKFDAIKRNIRWEEKEYDIILFNGGSLMLLSVKHRLHPNDIHKFVEKSIPAFKTIFPQYKDYRIYAGVAALSIDEGVEEMAEEQGLCVFTPSGYHQPEMRNASEFHPKEF